LMSTYGRSIFGRHKQLCVDAYEKIDWKIVQHAPSNEARGGTSNVARVGVRAAARIAEQKHQHQVSDIQRTIIIGATRTQYLSLPVFLYLLSCTCIFTSTRRLIIK